MNIDDIFQPSLISPCERAIVGKDIYEPMVLYPFSEGVTLSLKVPSSSLFFPKGDDHIEVSPNNSVLTAEGGSKAVQGLKKLSLKRRSMRSLCIQDEALGLGYYPHKSHSEDPWEENNQVQFPFRWVPKDFQAA
jgi:hypothetical protein